MRRVSPRQIALSALLAILALVSVAATTSASPGRRVYFATGGGPGKQYRPSLLAVSGDGTWTVHRMIWARWTTKIAQGTGVAWYYCHATFDGCIGGQIKRHRARITLWRPVLHCGVWYFSRARLTYLATNRPPSPEHFFGPSGVGDVSPKTSC